MKQLDLLDDATVSAPQPRLRVLFAVEDVEALLSTPAYEVNYDPRWCRPLNGRRVEIIDSPRFR